MTPKQLAFVQEHLKADLPTFTCSCGHAGYLLNPSLFGMQRIVKIDNMFEKGAEVVPFILLTCEYCALVRLFNAVAFGLIDEAGNFLVE